MRILFATMQFGRGYSQGTERYLSTLIDGLSRRGHETIVLAGDPERRGPACELGAVVSRDPLVLAYPTCDWAAVRGLPADAFDGLLRQLRPDVVHMANPGHVGLGLVLAARQHRIPTCLTTMDYWWVCPKHTLRRDDGRICDARVHWTDCVACTAGDREGGRRQQLARAGRLGGALLMPLYAARWLERGLPWDEIIRWTQRRSFIHQVASAASGIIFPSQTAQRILAALADGPRSYRIPYGLEPRWFSARSTNRTWRATQGEPAERTIGFAGALSAHKGPDLVLRAVRALGWRRVRVRLAGGGDDPGYLESLRRLADGMNVEFVGRVAAGEMPEFMRSLDALIVPSNWPENLPFVVLEAYASGTTVIASDVGGIAEIVSDPDQRFPVGSADGLADCLRRFAAADRPAAAPPISTADQMVEATLAAYDEIAAAAR